LFLPLALGYLSTKAEPKCTTTSDFERKFPNFLVFPKRIPMDILYVLRKAKEAELVWVAHLRTGKDVEYLRWCMQHREQSYHEYQ